MVLYINSSLGRLCEIQFKYFDAPFFPLFKIDEETEEYYRYCIVPKNINVILLVDNFKYFLKNYMKILHKNNVCFLFGLYLNKIVDLTTKEVLYSRGQTK